MITRRAIVALACIFILAGCSNVSSSDIRTQGITAHIAVAADASGNAQAGATLLVGSSLTNFVELKNGDSLTAKVGSTTQTLSASKLLGAVSYAATFNGQGAGGTQFTVSLNRTASDTSAPSSTCSLPQSFALTGPAAGQQFSRATSDIAVTYSGSGQSDPMNWKAVGDCIKEATGILSADTGSFVIPKGTLQAVSADGGSSTSCQVTLTVQRAHPGKLDPAYGGGDVSCQQNRDVTFTSAP